MAFSGHYAAAQLGKLDNSPLFRGYTFPLAREVSAYLGCVNDLVPPTYLHWSRLLGRLVSAMPAENIVVLLEELDGADWEASGSYTAVSERAFVDPVMTIQHATGTVDELYRAGRTPLFNLTIETPMSDEDGRFYSKWSRSYGQMRPLIARRTDHPALARHLAAYRRVEQEHLVRGIRYYREVNRRLENAIAMREEL